MSNQPWDMDDADETPFAIVRSVPIPIRFEIRDGTDEQDTLTLVSFYGVRRLARRRVTPEGLSEIRECSAWAERVPIVGFGRYEPSCGALVLDLRAEATEQFGWIDSDEAQVWLGYRLRPPRRQKFAGDLDRETRDLFGALLQGSPRAAIGKLFEEARREADWRHEARQRSGGHPPGRDIAEGVQRSRIQRKGGDA